MKIYPGKLTPIGVIILSLLIITFYRPQEKKGDEYYVNTVSQKEIELGRYEKLPPVKLKDYPFNDNTVSYIDFSNQYIRIYDFTTKEKDSINIRLKSRQYVQDYFFISPDSIIISHNPTWWRDYHDSVTLLIDRKGKILNTFSYDGAHVFLENGKGTGTRESWSFVDLTYINMRYIREAKAIYSAFSIFTHKYCDSVTVSDPPTVTGFVHLNNTSSDFKPLPIKFPCNMVNRYYPYNNKYIRGDFDSSGNGLFGFGHTSKLYYYDIQNDSIKEFYINFDHIDTVIPSETKYESFYDLEKPEYGEIIYDKYKKGWWRLGRLPLHLNHTPIEKNYPRHILMYVDSNFKKIREVILPFGYEPPLLPTENGFMIYDKPNSIKKGRIILRELELTTTRSKADHQDNLIKGNKISYIKQVSKKENLPYRSIILLNLERSCSSCLVYIADFLKQNKHSLEADEFAIVLISTNKGSIVKFLDENNLSIKGKNIFVDISTDYQYHFMPWYNAKLLNISNEGIESEHDYEPFEIVNMFSEIQDRIKN